MNGHSGFTLLELIVTLALAAIVLTLGVPSLQEWIRNNRFLTEVNEFVVALQLTRSEAVKRGVRGIWRWRCSPRITSRNSVCPWRSIEVRGPGRLPNAVTLENIRLGVRAERNRRLATLLTQLDQMSAIGTGIPRSIIRLSRQLSGREPEFVLVGEELRVRIWARSSISAG